MKQQVMVRCLWHEKIHDCALTSLALSPDGQDLYCGFSIENNKDETPNSSPLLQISARDGSVKSSIALPGSGQVCSAWVDSSSSSLHCCRADGTLASLNLSSDPQTSGVTVTMLNNVRPISSRPKSASSHHPSASNTPRTTTQAPIGPEFERSNGYRGPKDGYLYREGSLGNGYYRKDVVKKYTQGASTDATFATTTSTGASAIPSSYNLKKEKGVRCCSPSPKSEWVATASDDPNDGTVSIFKLPSHQSVDTTTKENTTQQQTSTLVTTLRGHSAGVLSFTVSPDGSLLFTGSYDQTVRVWETATWSCVKILKGHGGGVRALAVAADGRSLYSAAADNTVRAWNVGTWVCLRLMHGRHEDTTWPGCMALYTPPMPSESGHGQAELVTGSTGPFGGSTLKLFEPSTGECLATFAQLGYDQRGGVTAVVVGHSGDVVYSAASDGTVAAWKLEWKLAEREKKGTLRKGFLG